MALGHGLKPSITNKLAIAAAWQAQSRLMTPSPLALFSAILLVGIKSTAGRQARPVVINTWPFTEATSTAWEALQQGRPSLEAVQQVGS